MRETFFVVVCLAVTGNISPYPYSALEILDCCGQQVQVTGKVVAGLPSLAIIVVPGSVYQLKHIGYMRINIAPCSCVEEF